MSTQRRQPATAEFQPPRDVKAWWLAPHCGPGSTDTKAVCGYCGENVIDCALEATKIINEQHLQPGDGDVCTEGCGGSGFWCLGCKRFWAQNGCGENDYAGHQAADGDKLVEKDGYVWCVCGQKLMKKPSDR